MHHAVDRFRNGTGTISAAWSNVLQTQNDPAFEGAVQQTWDPVTALTAHLGLFHRLC